VNGLPPPGAVASEVVLTAGSFDGVHRGHQHLVRRAVVDAAAMAASPVALTFDPHPRCVLDPAGCPPLLTTIEERTGLLAADGVQQTVVIEFTRELSTWSASKFCDALLESLPIKEFVIGPGFALGHRRQGDEAFLRAYGAEHGFAVVTVPPLMRRGRRISSGWVREAVAAGRVGEARALLGQNYSVAGVVEHGDKRGAGLGFPTANITIDPRRCLPAVGVYATRVLVDRRWRDAATSIGFRPTFGGDRLTVEAYLLDFEGDLYGKHVRLEFASRLRGERTFRNATALIVQMHRDVENTIRRLRR
jgi:riboflavin kinase / FMN adenylyltransferase